MRFGGAIFAATLLAGSAAFAADEPICADRPGKANPSCTVPRGMVQVETGLADWARQGKGEDRSDQLAIGETAVKLGLGDRLHVEFDLPAHVVVRSRQRGVRQRLSGIGDSGVALKYRFTADASPVQAALYPFVKLPTAPRSLGNRKLEGGLALLADGPVGRSGLGWNIAPEIDVAADADGSGYHLSTAQAVSIAVPVTGRFSISGELWASWDFDPAGTVRQFSLDAAAAYLASPDLQLDSGINVGLTRDTPGVEIYSGVAFRF